MKRRCFLRQNRNGRQHTKYVTRQENNAFGLSTRIALGAFLNVLQRVAAATVFRQPCIAVVSVTLLVEHHVLDDRSSANSIPDDRFILAAEIDGFGVAAPFDIENGPLRPAVLVIANKVAIRVRRERSFARAG